LLEKLDCDAAGAEVVVHYAEKRSTMAGAEDDVGLLLFP
jgi:hypothetical protein